MSDIAIGNTHNFANPTPPTPQFGKQIYALITSNIPSDPSFQDNTLIAGQLQTLATAAQDSGNTTLADNLNDLVKKCEVSGFTLSDISQYQAQIEDLQPSPLETLKIISSCLQKCPKEPLEAGDVASIYGALQVLEQLDFSQYPQAQSFLNDIDGDASAAYLSLGQIYNGATLNQGNANRLQNDIQLFLQNYS